MRLILHVGMGKTGTSSIQAALAASKESLHAQNAHYLGMWFTLIDPALVGIQGVRTFFLSSPEELEAGADRMIAAMQEIKDRTGCDTFVFSNEDIYGHVGQLGPFLHRLAASVDLSIVLYVRDILSWMPSAYVQWSIRHKLLQGPIKPFREDAARWIPTYRALNTWKRDFGQWLVFRKFDKSVDVLEDFKEVTGLTFEKPKKRVLERAENAEVVLRALFNNRYPGEVFPARFDAQVLATNRVDVPHLDVAAQTYLNYQGADEVIAPYLDELRGITEQIGLDFLQGQAKSDGAPDVDALRNRLVDYLIEITLSQAEKISRLNERVKKLEESS